MAYLNNEDFKWSINPILETTLNFMLSIVFNTMVIHNIP